MSTDLSLKKSSCKEEKKNNPQYNSEESELKGIK